MWRSSGPSRGTHPLGAEGAAATRTRGDPKPTMTTEGTARRASGPAVPVRGCAVVVGPPNRRWASVERSSLGAPRDAPRRGLPRDSPAFCKRRAEHTCHDPAFGGELPRDALPLQAPGVGVPGHGLFVFGLAEALEQANAASVG